MTLPEPLTRTPLPDPVATQPLPPTTELTAEDIAAIRKTPPCRHCGGFHVRACPRVRRMAFHANGSLAEVEFWRGGQWSTEHIIWPEDLEDSVVD